jgi:hypothetical protein
MEAVMIRTRIWMLTAALIGGTTAAMPAAGGSAFDRWAEAIGGRERLSRVEAVYREATIDIAGFEGTIKAWHTADGRYRKEERVAAVSTVETFDGSHGALRQGAAPPMPLAGQDLERTRSMPFANWNAVFFVLFPSRLQGTRTAEGDVIVFRPEGGIDWQVTLDSSSGLPSTMRHQEGGRTVVVTFASYDTIDGLAFEREIHRSNGNPQFDAVIRFNKTVINPPLPPDLFSQAETP